MEEARQVVPLHVAGRLAVAHVQLRRAQVEVVRKRVDVRQVLELVAFIGEDDSQLTKTLFSFIVKFKLTLQRSFDLLLRALITHWWPVT